MFVRTALLIQKHKLHEFCETGVSCEVISGKRGACVVLACISNYREQRPWEGNGPVAGWEMLACHK
jgi:hypothetical protein